MERSSGCPKLLSTARLTKTQMERSSGSHLVRDDPDEPDAVLPDERIVFVYWISPCTDDEMLESHFSPYGELVDFGVVVDGINKFGFVEFADPSVIDRVVQDTHKIDKRWVEVWRPMLREEQEAAKNGPTGANSSGKVFVYGISPLTVDKKLETDFSGYGKLICSVPVDEKSRDLCGETVNSWLGVKRPIRDIKIWLRDLASLISEVHENGGFVGKLLDSVRVKDGKPVLMLPARNRITTSEDQTCIGKRKDIKAFGKLILTAIKSVDRVLSLEDIQSYVFAIRLCTDTHNRADTELDQQSYLVFHAPLFWDLVEDSFDLYNFVMALHLYRESDCIIFNNLVKDDAPNSPNPEKSIKLDWKSVLDAGKTFEARILASDQYKKRRNTEVYSQSASFVYFLRCFFQHPWKRTSLKDNTDFVYAAFPTAGVVLYKLFYYRVFLEDLKLREVSPSHRDLMPFHPVPFIKTSGHQFRF